MRIPQKVIDRIHYLLTYYMQGQDKSTATTNDHALKAAMDQQKTIGLELLPWEFLAKG